MPREQINYPDLTQKEYALRQREEGGYLATDPAPSEYEPWNNPALHVSWAPRFDGGDFPAPGWIQVALEADLSYLQFVMDSPNGSRKDRTMIWMPPLTVGDIDRLIKVLKKAKNKAFPTQE